MRAFHGFSEVPLVEDLSWIDHHRTTTLHQRLLQPVGAWSGQFHGEWGDLEQVIHGSQPWQLGRGFGEVYGKFCWVFHGFPLFGSKEQNLHGLKPESREFQERKSLNASLNVHAAAFEVRRSMM